MEAMSLFKGGSSFFLTVAPDEQNSLAIMRQASMEGRWNKLDDPVVNGNCIMDGLKSEAATV